MTGETEPALRALVLPPLVVHSILAGGVRRVALPLSPQPELVTFSEGGAYWTWQARPSLLLDNIHSRWPDELLPHAPLAVGERVWVKETWAAIWPEWCEDGLLYDDEHPDGRPLRLEECVLEYRADSLAPYPGHWPEEAARGNPEAPKWRSPVHMPRTASRLTLLVTRVHAERVSQVTERGSLREGVSGRVARSGGREFTPFPPLPNGQRQVAERRAKEAYARRWQELYGRKHRFEEDPWVWRVDFELVEAPAA